MLRKKVFKILSVLVAVLIAFSCCCIPASAQSVGTNVKYFADFCSLDYAQISYLRDGVSSSSEPISSSDWVNMTDFSSSELVNNSLFVSVSGDTGYDIWQWLKIRVQFKIKPAYRIEGYYSGSFLLTLLEGLEKDFVFINYSRLPEPTLLFTGSGESHYGQLSYNHHMRYTGVLTSNPNPVIFDTFVCEFYIMNQKRLYSNYQYEFNFSNLNMNIVTRDEKTINAIIQSNNENADKIMDNQNKNTDKILNGGSDKPHYNATDTTVTDNYHAIEEQLNNSTSGSRSDSISFFNNFGNILSNVHLSKGLLAVSKLMTDVFSISWISTLVQFSLVLGAFSFILGMASIVIGRVSSGSKPSKNTNNSKADKGG